MRTDADADAALRLAFPRKTVRDCGEGHCDEARILSAVVTVTLNKNSQMVFKIFVRMVLYVRHSFYCTYIKR